MNPHWTMRPLADRSAGCLRGLTQFHEEQGIATRLWVVDGKLAAEESRRAALAALFQSLRYNQMTGRVRLPGFANGAA